MRLKLSVKQSDTEVNSSKIQLCTVDAEQMQDLHKNPVWMVRKVEKSKGRDTLTCAFFALQVQIQVFRRIQ